MSLHICRVVRQVARLLFRCLTSRRHGFSRPPEPSDLLQSQYTCWHEALGGWRPSGPVDGSGTGGAGGAGGDGGGASDGVVKGWL